MTMERVGTERLVTVFGGSGFVGRHVVGALARDGWRVRVACRRPDLAFFLQPLGRPGQVMPVQANVRDAASVAAALRGADAAVNLVGILAEGGKQKFAAIHAEGARAVAQAVKAAGISNFVHISAIGADAGSASSYARTKAQGEAAVFEAVPEAVILRPSVMFGPEDDFFNRFGTMARYFPVIPIVGAKTKFQPVYVGDVARAVALALAGKATQGRDLRTRRPGGEDLRATGRLCSGCRRARPPCRQTFVWNGQAGRRDHSVFRHGVAWAFPEAFDDDWRSGRAAEAR